MAKLRNRRLIDPRAFLSRHKYLPLERQLEEIWSALSDIYRLVSPFTITVTADYTTTGSVAIEEVECNNTSAITITLHSPPKDRDIVVVSRLNSGGVTIATAGSETINGASSLVISSQYATPNLIYREDTTDWRIF